jgi:hypothetical protein
MASTYAAGLRARLDQQHEKAFGQPGFQKPSDEVVEQQFQEKLTSGYQRYVKVGFRKVRNRCEECFTYRSANGTCNCQA